MEWWEEPDQPVVPSLSRNLDLLSMVNERPRFFDKLRMAGVGAGERSGGEQDGSLFVLRPVVCCLGESPFDLWIPLYGVGDAPGDVGKVPYAPDTSLNLYVIVTVV